MSMNNFRYNQRSHEKKLRILGRVQERLGGGEMRETRHGDPYLRIAGYGVRYLPGQKRVRVYDGDQSRTFMEWAHACTWMEEQLFG